MAVMDIIYNPPETKLLAMARSRGCVTISGLSMFIHQGAEQFRLFTGGEPPAQAMTTAVLKALSGEKR
jgi:shikimate 5-dehydrogenase